VSEFTEDDIANLLESIKLGEAKIYRYRTALENIQLYLEVSDETALSKTIWDITVKALAEWE